MEQDESLKKAQAGRDNVKGIPSETEIELRRTVGDRDDLLSQVREMQDDIKETETRLKFLEGMLKRNGNKIENNLKYHRKNSKLLGKR